jgi:hypothetical protein
VLEPSVEPSHSYWTKKMAINFIQKKGTGVGAVVGVFIILGIAFSAQ